MSELSRLYTPNQPSTELVAKQAEAELFAKLAAANNIDLNALTDDQIGELYSLTFNKQAEFPPPAEGKKPEEGKEEKETAKEEEEEEKKEAAAREHATKLAAANDEANAYRLGQVMAQGYMDQLQKFGSALQSPEAPAAGAPAAQTEETKEASVVDKAIGKIRNATSIVGGKARKLVGDMPAGKAGRSAPGQAERTKNVGRAVLGGGAALAAGGAALAAGKKKESSALDVMAMEQAVKIAEADGRFDLEEVAERILAVNTLGLQDSTKLASTVPEQANIRALEFLEAAGYPVEWAQ